MSPDSPKLFNNPEDYGCWDPYILECDFIEGLTIEDRQRAKRALEDLRKVLGENFIKRALANGHPLLFLFLNRAPWTRSRLISLADAVETMRSADNFDTALKRIKAVYPIGTDGEFVAGYSVLMLAQRFDRAGFRVRFVDDRRGSYKRPDLELINDETGEEVSVEVSALNIPAEVKKIEDVNRFIFLQMSGIETAAQVTIYSQMLRRIDESGAAAVVVRVNQLAAEVGECGELRQLIDDDIAVGIAPRHKIEELNQWAAGHGLSPGFAGPPMTISEIPRVQRKVNEKLTQLPDDKPGIIVIPYLSNFLFQFNGLSQIISELERQASESPNLLAIALSQGYTDEPLGDIVLEQSGPHIIVNRIFAGCIKEPIVIVKNRAFALGLSLSTMEKFERAFC